MRAVLATVLFLAAGLAAAAPPTLDIPPEVRPSGQYVQFVPKTDAVGVEYVGLDGVEPFPSAFLKDSRAFVLDATALQRDKAYRFVAVGASKTGEQSRAAFVVVGGKAPTTPPIVNPPPKDPPPTPAAGLYLLVVRPDGPAAPAFTRLMGNPAWDELRKAGHWVKDMPLAEAASKGFVPGFVPGVMVLELPAGASRSVLRRTAPLPTTAADILDLPKEDR
jgi:hypothetical protein